MSVQVAPGTVRLHVPNVMWSVAKKRFRTCAAAHAGAGALLGFFLVPVAGAIPGFLCGIYLSERLRLGGHARAVTSLRTAMRAGGWSVLTELFACLLIMGAWLGAGIWG